MLKELTAEQVRQRCDPALFNCNSTEELAPIEGIIGQDRALSALEFGLNILHFPFGSAFHTVCLHCSTSLFDYEG